MIAYTPIFHRNAEYTNIRTLSWGPAKLSGDFNFVIGTTYKIKNPKWFFYCIATPATARSFADIIKIYKVDADNIIRSNTGDIFLCKKIKILELAKT